MGVISQIFYRFNVQLLYILMIPFYFLVFVLIYTPFDVDEFLDMGKGQYAFNLIMVGCILMLVLLVTRLTLYFTRQSLRLSQGWYIFWCCMEVVVITHFMTLYMWLRLDDVPYLEVLGQCFYILSFILVFPYVIIGLSLRLSDKQTAVQEQMNGRMKFHDDRGNVKFMADSVSVLYIAAEENYVRIHYIEKDKMKDYVLRNTMKNMEETCSKHGLVRCHRSYYINKCRVKSIRKEKEGYIVAEIDAPERLHIPVSTRYYDTLAVLL